MNKILQINPSTMKQPTKAYSNGILVPFGDGAMMFLTGQLAQDSDGKVVFPNDVENQTRFIIGHIKEILADGGMTLDNIVKLTIYVTDISLGPKVSEVRDELLTIARPASTLVEVNALVKPECCVEIEAIAVRLK